MNVPRKYGLLRFIAFILKLLAWIVLLVGIGGMVLALIGLGSGLTNNQPGWLQMLPWVGALGLPLLAVIWFVQLFAFGSILSLLIDIEENSRRLTAQATAPPPVVP